MVRNPNYKQIRELLRTKTEFTGRSMSAKWGTLGLYYIFSYNTLIATYNSNKHSWWVNPNKYSHTTTKQQNIIRFIASQDDNALVSEASDGAVL